MKPFAAIILAAGMGTRMRSSMAKVLHCVNGRPMILYPLEMVNSLGVHRAAVVLGHQASLVEEALEGINFDKVIQDKQLGTGHAVKCAEKLFSDFDGDIIVLNGDSPLLTAKSVTALLKKHRQDNNSVTVLTAESKKPYGLGRIIRSADGKLQRIVEEKDATEEERAVKEVSTGVYAFDSRFLFSALKKVKSDNAQSEYYLPDVVKIALSDKKKVDGMSVSDENEVLGINNRVQLAEVSDILRMKILEKHMMDGVTVIQPSSTFVESGVSIGRDTIIYPMVSIGKNSVIGSGCIIESGSRIFRSKLGNNVMVKNYSDIHNAVLEDRTSIGPFAHLRPGSVIMEGAKIGNFVETKKSEIGKGSKVSHLTYIGDANIGKNVNIGAGTITCNYDGKNKYRTVIEDDVFVGSDTQFVAPVTVRKGSVIAAGSTITRNVSENSLAISRSKQDNKEGWALYWNRKKDE